MGREAMEGSHREGVLRNNRSHKLTSLICLAEVFTRPIVVRLSRTNSHRTKYFASFVFSIMYLLCFLTKLGRPVVRNGSRTLLNSQAADIDIKNKICCF